MELETERLKNNQLFCPFLNGSKPFWFEGIQGHFANYAIDFVPIPLKKNRAFRPLDSQNHLLMGTLSLREQRAFRSLFDKYLDMRVKSGYLHLYHISSYPPPYQLKGQEHYHYFRLPENRENLCHKIAGLFMAKMKLENHWPWGKRKKLPSLLFEE